MHLVFEESDYQKTPLGEISLRRRAEPRVEGKIIYEVKLGDGFLIIKNNSQPTVIQI